MIKKILLMDIENIQENSVGHLGTSWSHHPIGVLYLAAIVRRAFPDIEIKVFHTVTSETPKEDIEKLLLDYNPDLVGLRALSRFKSEFIEIAKLSRGILPNCHIIGGGPYPSSSAEQLLCNKIVDIVIIGEGEATITELIHCIQNNGCIPLELEGTAVLVNGQISVNAKRVLINNLDDIPFPDYSYIRVEDYKNISNHAFQSSSDCAFICSSRGCPYNCFYCHQFFGKKIRRRSPDNVVEEIKNHYYSRGITEFVFVDDTFNIPLDEGKLVLEKIAQEFEGKIKINFPNGLRADQLDEEFIDLLARCGLVHVALAVESASARIQKIIGKNLDIKKARWAIERMSREFITCVFFMVGFPEETLDDAMQTINFAETLDYVAQPVLSILRIYEETPLFQMLKPSTEQILLLKEQETMDLQTKLLGNQSFYGDFFPNEIVPLKGRDISAIRFKWMQKVIMNKPRLRNSYQILKKHMSQQRIMEFYKNFFDNDKFDEKELNRLVK